MSDDVRNAEMRSDSNADSDAYPYGNASGPKPDSDGYSAGAEPNADGNASSTKPYADCRSA